jgi:hypothetical protein
MGADTEISLAPATHLEAHFLPLFQAGLYLKGKVGISVREFLAEYAHVDPRYLEQRVQTVFLDGKAVDDLDSAFVRQNSALTLSAAMPGLLGATLRLGSRYAPMRSQISHHDARGAPKPAEGWIFLKLFNLLISELGPPLLRKGVWIPGRIFGEFFKFQTGLFWSKCEEVGLNGRPVKPETLKTREWTEELVLLRLEDK